MRRTSLFLSAALFGLLLVAQPTFAATTDTATAQDQAATAAVTAIETQAQAAAPTYVGLEAQEAIKLPTNFGQLWRNLKETVSLALVFDPNRKAALAMKFADEHMLIAQKAAESKDTKEQANAQKELERANKLMDKAQKNQDKALENPNKETNQLLKNRAVQVGIHQEILDQIEAKLGSTDQNQLMDVRAKFAEQNKRLENAISNEKIPEDVRAKLEALKTSIETHAATIKANVEEMQTLREAVQNGDTTAQAKIDDLKAKRLEDVKANIEIKQQSLKSIQDKMDALKTAAEKGNKKAADVIQKIQNMPELQNKLEEIQNRIQKHELESEDEPEELETPRPPKKPLPPPPVSTGTGVSGTVSTTPNSVPPFKGEDEGPEDGE